MTATREIRQWFLTHFDYNPITGDFTNRISGNVANRKSPKGYIILSGLRNRVFYAHRVAYLIMEGEWPNQIDHRNRVRDDNRWENLLNADQFINAQNHGLRCTNTSGHTGIEIDPERGFRGELSRHGTRKKSKWFPTIEEAVAAREEFMRQFAAGEWELSPCANRASHASSPA